MGRETALGGRQFNFRTTAYYGGILTLRRNLAYMEMRLILTRLLWEFDLELCKESEGWEKQKVFVLWEKPSLWVRCTSVKRDNVPR